MIALVEGASRQKTPNEIALTILLAGFTLVFVIVCVTLQPFAEYSKTPIAVASFIALFVCLIPTTIGGLLSAIGIAGMDRALRANVITKSGKAVETAGDIDVLLLDKTGTITIGNRKATHFWPAPGVAMQEFIEQATVSSLTDETPEGKSIVELARDNKVDPAAAAKPPGRGRAHQVHGRNPQQRRDAGRRHPHPQGRGRCHPQAGRGRRPGVPRRRGRPGEARWPATAAPRWW